MLGGAGKFKLWGKSSASASERPAVAPQPASSEPPKEHPAVALLRQATIKINQLPVGRDSLLQIVEGSTQVWNQSLSAYRSLCVQGKYEEALAKALADYAEAAAQMHVRSIAYAGDSLSESGRELATASGLRYWRVRKQIQSVSGGRFSPLNELPGRILAATGMPRQELENWFDGNYSQYREARQEFVVGAYLDTVPFTSLSLIQAEVVFCFLNRIGAELKFVEKVDDPQRARNVSLEDAVVASGVGGTGIKNAHLDISLLRTKLLDLTASLRREGIPAHLQGFTKNPAILIAMLVPVLAYWSPERPKRKHERVKQKGEMEVVLGVPDVLRSMRAEPASHVDTWTRTDHDDSGLGAMAFSLRKDYQPGSLIGYREKGADLWQVGVVRRLNRTDAGRYSIGIQRIERITSRMLETEMEPGKVYQTYCLHMDQAIILNRAQIPQGRLLRIYGDRLITARNFSVAEVGGNYEMHLLAEETV